MGMEGLQADWWEPEEICGVIVEGSAEISGDWHPFGGARSRLRMEIGRRRSDPGGGRAVSCGRRCRAGAEAGGGCGNAWWAKLLGSEEV